LRQNSLANLAPAGAMDLEYEESRQKLVARRTAHGFALQERFERREDHLIEAGVIAEWVAALHPRHTRRVVLRRFVLSVTHGGFGWRWYGERRAVARLVDLVNIDPGSFGFEPGQYPLRPTVLTVEMNPNGMRAPRSVWLEWLRAQELPVPRELASSVLIEGQAAELRGRAAPALPTPSAEPTAPRRKRERRYWEPLRNLAFDWIDKNGVPVSGDGRQAELARYIEHEINQLPKPHPVWSTIKSHVVEWIKQYRPNRPNDKVTPSPD
jgi:hypothetical protein